MVTNSTGFVSFTADEAIEEGERVLMAADGNIDLAGAGEVGIGVATRTTASGGICPVKLWNAPGTFPVRTSAAVAAGARLYATAAGEVDDGDAGTMPLPLIAKEASTANDDIIEALPYGNAHIPTVDTTVEAEVTALDALTFSATVDQAEAEALRDETVDAIQAIVARLIDAGIFTET